MIKTFAQLCGLNAAAETVFRFSAKHSSAKSGMAAFGFADYYGDRRNSFESVRLLADIVE